LARRIYGWAWRNVVVGEKDEAHGLGEKTGGGAKKKMWDDVIPSC